MKRVVLIALCTLVLISIGFVWLRTGVSAGARTELSSKDFKRIQEVTRRAMWRRAFPGFSWKTIKSSPSSLRRVMTSRIRQIDVLPFKPGKVRVQVQSGSDIYCYLVDYIEQSGKWDWRVVREGSGPLVTIINLSGGPGFTEIRVDGGFGLLGGRLSSKPVELLLPPPRRLGSDPATTVSNEFNLTYETHPYYPDYVPFLTDPTQRSVFSERDFSASISNRASVNLSR